MLYILLMSVDDTDEPDCGTSWAIYEAENPEEVLDRAEIGVTDQFFIVEAGKAIGPKPGLAEVELRDYGTGD